MNIKCRRSHSRRRLAVELLETRWLPTSGLWGTDVSAVAGQDATLTVLNFQSDSALDVAAASIDWGDGSPATPGVVRHLGLANPAFDEGSVTGDHIYQAAGSYTITVKVQESGSIGDGQTATLTSSATVESNAAQGVSFSATTNQPDQGQVVAYFPAASATDSPDNYTATIDWGDGTKSTGTVFGAVLDPGGPPVKGEPTPVPVPVSSSGSTAPGAPNLPVPGPVPPVAGLFFWVSGDHTYTSSGTYTVQVTITSQAGQTQTTKATATVADDTITAFDYPVFAPVNQSSTLTVAGFQDAAGLPPSAFTVTIDWGDGTPTTSGQVEPGPVVDPLPPVPVPVTSPPATVSGGASGSGSATGTIGTPLPPVPLAEYLVTGDHTYATAGTYTIQVTITSSLGASAVATSTAEVGADKPIGPLPPIPVPVGPPIPVVVSPDPGSGTTSEVGADKPIGPLPPIPIVVPPNQGPGTTTPPGSTGSSSPSDVVVGASHPGKTAQTHAHQTRTHVNTTAHRSLNHHKPKHGRGKIS